ncbi:hypothetical protein [Actinomycetospora cinnamomea]|nr:hypothetical protein [Actinomycetospora cinnamomea]
MSDVAGRRDRVCARAVVGTLVAVSPAPGRRPVPGDPRPPGAP